jgi:hypothetical protein
MSDRYYYLDQFADEVMPCAANLDAWAKWLSEPDLDWDHGVPADGATFKCSTMDILGDVVAEHDGEAWRWPAAPAGTDCVYARYGERAGWNAENAGPDVETALTEVEPDEAPVWLACTRQGPSLIVVYRADPPRLEIVTGRA